MMYLHIVIQYLCSLNKFSLYSLLYIETADRPGLLLEIYKILTDTNIDVDSAEIDTEVY
jgi:UTP:GlnB (protein PII) uridylyltransferase